MELCVSQNCLDERSSDKESKKEMILSARFGRPTEPPESHRFGKIKHAWNLTLGPVLSKNSSFHVQPAVYTVVDSPPLDSINEPQNMDTVRLTMRGS